MSEIASRAQLRADMLRWALVLVPVVLLLGAISGAAAGRGAADPWYMALAKPAFSPPPASFAVVWSVLYVMMGLAMALVAAARGAAGRRAAVIAFVVQLALNLAWSPVFFGLHRMALAVVLTVLIDSAVLVTVVCFWRVRRSAAALLVPLLAWCLFATLLAWQFWALNPGADGPDADGRAGPPREVRLQLRP